MAGSRTIKTLTALVITMTIGAFALILLETAPILPPVPFLTAQSLAPTDKIIEQTDTPIRPEMWRNIVLHIASEGQHFREKCHFTVDGTNISATTHWKKQLTTDHIVPYVRGHDYNADSIGVFVKTDFMRRPPSAEESRRLAELITAFSQRRPTTAEARRRTDLAELIAAFAQRPPSTAELEKLSELITMLQKTCSIDHAKVYFHSDLNPYVPMPDEVLVNGLSDRLLKIER